MCLAGIDAVKTYQLADPYLLDGTKNIAAKHAPDPIGSQLVSTVCWFAFAEKIDMVVSRLL